MSSKWSGETSCTCKFTSSGSKSEQLPSVRAQRRQGHRECYMSPNRLCFMLPWGYPGRKAKEGDRSTDRERASEKHLPHRDWVIHNTLFKQEEPVMQEVGSWPSSPSPPGACEQPVRNIRHVIENKEVSLPCRSKCSTSPFVIQLHLFSFSQWNRNMLLYLQLNVGLSSPVILSCPHPLSLFPSGTPRSARATVLWHKQISVLVLTTANLHVRPNDHVFTKGAPVLCFLCLEGPLPLPLPHLTAYS